MKRKLTSVMDLWRPRKCPITNELVVSDATEKVFHSTMRLIDGEYLSGESAAIPLIEGKHICVETMQRCRLLVDPLPPKDMYIQVGETPSGRPIYFSKRGTNMTESLNKFTNASLTGTHMGVESAQYQWTCRLFR